MLCAFCNDFLLNALGYQCEDCRYTCHKKCYEKVVTKCISKSYVGVRKSIVCFMNPADFVRRKAMKRKSITVFRTGSSLSQTLAQTGVVIAVICCHWVARTPANVLNATSLAMQIAHTSYRISVVCLWRLPTNSSGIGVTLIGQEVIKLHVLLNHANTWTNRSMHNRRQSNPRREP